MSDDAIATFIGLTQATHAVAARVLDMTGGDVDSAVQLYLDDPAGFVTVDDDDMDQPARAPRGRGTPPPSRGARNDKTDVVEDDNVRAPIPQRREVLVGPPAMGLGFELPFIAQRAVLRNMGEGDAPFPYGPFGPNPTVPLTWLDRSGDSRLQALFKPPHEIMFIGSFQDAQRQAASQQKWLMVNVRKHGEFKSEAQNRDLWSQAEVKEFVREYFVFLQLHSETEEGQRFVRLYPPTSYPYIAIIDPRTGELRMTIEREISPHEFLCNVTDWLIDNSLEDEIMQSRRPAKRLSRERPPPGPSSGSAANGKSSQKLHELTEEEQLELALAASLEATSRPEISAAATGPSSSSAAPVARAVEKAPTPSQPPAPPKPRIVAALRPPVPPKDLAATRLQIRLSDGTKKVYNFLKTDPVILVYQHIKADIPALASTDFELMLHTEKTSDKLDQSIEEAHMANASLNVVTTE